MRWYDWLGLGWYSLMCIIAGAFAVAFFGAVSLIGWWGVLFGGIFTTATVIFAMMCYSIWDLNNWDK